MFIFLEKGVHKKGVSCEPLNPLGNGPGGRPLEYVHPPCSRHGQANAEDRCGLCLLEGVDGKSIGLLRKMLVQCIRELMKVF